MIVREILNNPQLIDTFDFFNDFDDTIAWLDRAVQRHPEAAEVAAKLRTNYEAWKVARNKRCQAH